MPVLLVGVDDDDIPGVQDELEPATVHDHAPTAQPEEQLNVVMGVPVRARALFEGYSVETNRLSVVGTEKSLRARGEHEVLRVGTAGWTGRLIDHSHGDFSDGSVRVGGWLGVKKLDAARTG